MKPTIFDPKNPHQSIRYAITWHIKRTGYLPVQIVIPGTIEMDEATARALATEMKTLGIAVHVDSDAAGITCQNLGKPIKLHQLPWSPLYG